MRIRKSIPRVSTLRVVVVITWGLICVWGLTHLWRYENAPGVRADAPADWPTDTIIPRHERRPTLVMFAHPRCPCTRASIAELERVVAKADVSLKPIVVFLKPDNFEDGWEQTDLWRTAAAIPGADVISDRNGQEARRFGVVTSGQVLLYDVDGRLLYSGGITSARGHQGDNTGRDAVVSLLTQGAAGDHDSPVFGCPLSFGGTP